MGSTMVGEALCVLCPLQGFSTGTGDPCGSSRCARLAVPRCPLTPWLLAEAEAGMAAGREGGSIVPGLLLCVLESSTAASLPGWAGPERTGDTGTAGDKGCCVCAEQQVPVAPGCHRQPRWFPALALPFLKIVFVLFLFFFFFFWAGGV